MDLPGTFSPMWSDTQPGTFSPMWSDTVDSGRSSIIGRSVQQIVTKGTGVVQQFIRHR